jgi:hypothetical protein
MSSFIMLTNQISEHVQRPLLDLSAKRESCRSRFMAACDSPEGLPGKGWGAVRVGR